MVTLQISVAFGWLLQSMITSKITFILYICECVIVVYRTAINSDSGVRTPAGGIFTGKTLSYCSLYLILLVVTCWILQM